VSCGRTEERQAARVAERVSGLSRNTGRRRRRSGQQVEKEYGQAASTASPPNSDPSDSGSTRRQRRRLFLRGATGGVVGEGDASRCDIFGGLLLASEYPSFPSLLSLAC
jgi:hypothetical protein